MVSALRIPIFYEGMGLHFQERKGITPKNCGSGNIYSVGPGLNGGGRSARNYLGEKTPAKKVRFASHLHNRYNVNSNATRLFRMSTPYAETSEKWPPKQHRPTHFERCGTTSKRRPTKQLVGPYKGKRPLYGATAECRRAVLLFRFTIHNAHRNIQSRIRYDRPHTYVGCNA